MKITFYRKGHANNSSSSHSLIFTEDYKNITTDEYTHFGWDNFTCGDIESKKNYIYACLRESYYSSINLHYTYSEDIPYEKIEGFKFKCFTSWVKTHFKEFNFKPCEDICVDHQSIFYFPTYRDHTKGINKLFAKKIIEEILKPQYVFIGGNDNSDYSHPLRGTGELKQVINIWRTFKDTYKLGQVEYDEKTGEFVFGASSFNGSILKIKF